jgi:NitT/TauT family transport system ATP-binding protein
MSGSPHIEVRGLSKRWPTRDGSVPALEDVTLTVGAHEFLTVLGPSGCGKFPWRTAIENVEFGLELQGVPAARRREIARGLLRPVGLMGFEQRYPRELSGGMKQRVGIARALALDAPILLMDEPFGALDEQTRLLMGEWLLGIWAETRKTVVFVTHSLQEAILLSQRIVVMTARPGRIKGAFDVDVPAPRDLDHPTAVALRAGLWAAIRDESRRALAHEG